VRFTFRIVSLQDGIGLIPALIGFFCIPEVLAMIEKRDQQYSIIPYREQRKVVLTVTLKLLKRPFLLLHSAVIGTIVWYNTGCLGQHSQHGILQ